MQNVNMHFVYKYMYIFRAYTKLLAHYTQSQVLTYYTLQTEKWMILIQIYIVELNYEHKINTNLESEILHFFKYLWGWNFTA